MRSLVATLALCVGLASSATWAQEVIPEDPSIATSGAVQTDPVLAFGAAVDPAPALPPQRTFSVQPAQSMPRPVPTPPAQEARQAATATPTRSVITIDAATDRCASCGLSSNVRPAVAQAPRLSIQTQTCSPRPPVSTSVDRSGTVRVTASSSVGVPANQLQELRFLRAENAAITVPGGPVGSAGNFPILLPLGTQQVTFTVQALAAGLAATVPFVVVDNCGDWPTFAGGGPDVLPVATPPLNPTAIPLLISPTGLNGMRTVDFFDHDLPFEFTDTNGFQLTYWGERWYGGVDGHSGYDWPLPVGTPLFAAAAGKVVVAGVTGPFFCPLLNRIVTDATQVDIEVSAQSQQFVISYNHLSQVDVAVGQLVGQGQQIGLSGNTGCSGGPHLHFGTFRVLNGGARWVLTDPYGWAGSGIDPWSVYPTGASSINLWLDGHGPEVYDEVAVAPNPSGSTARVAITRVRFMGVDDAQFPNNEFIEVSLDPRFVPSGQVDMTGFTLRNNAGDIFAFPAGYTLTSAPVHVYSGAGSADATTLYWGRGSGLWANGGDCARLVYPAGGAYRIRYGSSQCP